MYMYSLPYYSCLNWVSKQGSPDFNHVQFRLWVVQILARVNDDLVSIASSVILINDQSRFWSVQILISSDFDQSRFWSVQILISSDFDQFRFWSVQILISSDFDQFRFWSVQILIPYCTTSLCWCLKLYYNGANLPFPLLLYTIIFLTLSAVGSAHLCPWYSEVERFNGRLAQTNGSCNFHALHITQDLGKEGHRLGTISFQSLNKVDLIDRWLTQHDPIVRYYPTTYYSTSKLRFSAFIWLWREKRRKPEGKPGRISYDTLPL